MFNVSEFLASSPSLSVTTTSLFKLTKSSALKLTESSWFALSGWDTALFWSRVTSPLDDTDTVNTCVSTLLIVTYPTTTPLSTFNSTFCPVAVSTSPLSAPAVFTAKL